MSGVAEVEQVEEEEGKQERQLVGVTSWNISVRHFFFSKSVSILDLILPPPVVLVTVPLL